MKKCNRKEGKIKSLIRNEDTREFTESKRMNKKNGTKWVEIRRKRKNRIVLDFLY
jgi:hypothetical protein